MTNVEALKGLYVVLGGQLTDTYSDIADGAPVSDYNTIPDCILAVTKKATGAIELPVVSSTDNGDVLTVVDGAWNKATPESGLPDVTAEDEGKVLTVDNSGGWVVETPSDDEVIITGTFNNTTGTVTWDNGTTNTEVYAAVNDTERAMLILTSSTGARVDILTLTQKYADAVIFGMTSGGSTSGSGAAQALLGWVIVPNDNTETIIKRVKLIST